MDEGKRENPSQSFWPGFSISRDASEGESSSYDMLFLAIWHGFKSSDFARNKCIREKGAAALSFFKWAINNIPTRCIGKELFNRIDTYPMDVDHFS